MARSHFEKTLHCRLKYVCSYTLEHFTLCRHSTDCNRKSFRLPRVLERCSIMVSSFFLRYLIRSLIWARMSYVSSQTFCSLGEERRRLLGLYSHKGSVVTEPPISAVYLWLPFVSPRERINSHSHPNCIQIQHYRVAEVLSAEENSITWTLGGCPDSAQFQLPSTFLLVFKTSVTVFTSSGQAPLR